MALKVLLVAELTGGVGVYGRNLAHGLDAMGVEVTALTPTPELSTAGRAIAARRFSGRGRWLPQAVSFARRVKEHGDEFDVIHFTDARYAAFVRGGKTPLVGTMNDYFYAITGWFSG